MISLDGSQGEGGGQILRYALAFSALTGKAFRLKNIRKNRPHPGLALQHAACIEAYLSWPGFKATGVYLGSEEVEFFPSRIVPKSLTLNVGSAGSITLILQALLPALCFSEGRVRVKITGGTDVPWSIPYDTFRQVVLFYYARVTREIASTLQTRGYYPAGGGRVELSVMPLVPRMEQETFQAYQQRLWSACPIFLISQDVQLRAVQGKFHASREWSQERTLERGTQAVQAFLRSQDVAPVITSEYALAQSPGGGISLWASFADTRTGDIVRVVGSDGLLDRPDRSEKVCSDIAQQLLREMSEGDTDTHTTDSLIPLLAVLGGELHVREITPHMLSAAHVAQKFGFPVEVLTEKKLIQVRRS